MRHAVTEMMNATISPAAAACHAGRRRTPSITRTTATGKTATRNDRARLPPSGVNNCWNMRGL